MRRALATALAIGGLLVGAAGCTKNQLIDMAMRGSGHGASALGMRVGDKMILAGDMHCHVMPPDSEDHVSRQLAETLALAKKENLDFVVLTPHVPASFQTRDVQREWVVETQRELRARVAAAASPDLLVVPGFEYTDRQWGHIGMAFADVERVLAKVSTDDARRAPERFFDEWIIQGGVITINHPVNKPLRDPPFSQLAYNLSWRAFHGAEVPSEIDFVTKHAQAVETFNVSVTHLRDQFIVGEEDRSLNEASHLVDRIARQQQRHIAAVGGSDSHGAWLRASTYVLATEKTIAALHDGIVSARTCVRGPEGCTLEVRPRGSEAWSHVGDELPADARPKTDPTADIIEARATGGDVTLFVNGEIVGTAESGDTMTARLPHGRCAIVRAIVGRSWSSGVYVGCRSVTMATPEDLRAD